MTTLLFRRRITHFIPMHHFVLKISSNYSGYILQQYLLVYLEPGQTTKIGRFPKKFTEKISITLEALWLFDDFREAKVNSLKID